VAVRVDDLGRLREDPSDWHLWEASDGTLRPRIRLPWERALHDVNGVPHLRPEVALLHNAHLDRPKDRDGLAAARLDPGGRAWLAGALTQVGYREWADLVRAGAVQAGAVQSGG
jgi:hypothetical protein